MPVISTSPDPSTTHAWRSIRRWHLATALIALVAWVVATIVLVLGGEVPSPSSETLNPGQKRSDVWPASLALRRIRGRPREIHTDLLRSFSVRWRGPGAMIKGVVWLDRDELLWAPNRRSRSLGAHEFAVKLPSLEDISVSRFSGSGTGLVLKGSDAEVWFWLPWDSSSLIRAFVETSG
jgi:hypothetical protein